MTIPILNLTENVDHLNTTLAHRAQCRIECRIKNRRRVFTFKGYIQSVTFIKHGQPYSHIGMVFSGHVILSDVKSITVMREEELGNKCYSIIVGV